MDIFVSLADLKEGLVEEKIVYTSKSWRAGRRLRRLGRGLCCRSPAAVRGQRRERRIWLAKTFCSRGSDGIV